ncbi:hypothetical protein BC833DRAFT_659744 [Globomyces pollinis-pini]|nr:hypothetical protein BC833DRAFT_659744 [Globomyces pollinis-pini]
MQSLINCCCVVLILWSGSNQFFCSVVFYTLFHSRIFTMLVYVQYSDLIQFIVAVFFSIASSSFFINFFVYIKPNSWLFTGQNLAIMCLILIGIVFKLFTAVCINAFNCSSFAYHNLIFSSDAIVGIC